MGKCRDGECMLGGNKCCAECDKKKSCEGTCGTVFVKPKSKAIECKYYLEEVK